MKNETKDSVSFYTKFVAVMLTLIIGVNITLIIGLAFILFYRV